MNNNTNTTALTCTTPQTGLSTGGVALRFSSKDTSTFINVYLTIGIPFTIVTLLCAVILRKYFNYRFDRTLLFAYSVPCIKNHPNVASQARRTWWLGRFIQIMLTVPFLLLIVWGTQLTAITSTPMLSVCAFLLFPAFFLWLWTSLAWSENGYSFYFGRHTKFALVPVLWLLCVGMVFAFNGLAVFLDKSFSFISVSWFFISLNMLPLIFLAHWNQPGGGKREDLWKNIGSQNAITNRRKTVGGEGGEDGEDGSEDASRTGRGDSLAAVTSVQATKVPLVWNVSIYLVSVLVLIIYSLVVLILPSLRCTDFGDTGKWTGVVTSITFLVLDAVTFILHGSHLLTNPLSVNMVLLVSRGCVVSFGAQLWYVGHAAMFLVYGLTVGTICVAYRLQNEADRKSRLSGNSDNEEETDSLRTKTIAVTRPRGLFKHPYTAMAILLIAVVIELIMVVLVVPKTFDIATVVLMDGTPHNQYEFGFGALFLVIGWTIFYLWFHLMQNEAKRKGVPDIYVFTQETKLLLLLFILYFVAGGIGLYIVTTSYLILFTAIFVPPMLISGLLLYGRWVGNDFKWCQKRSLRRNTKGDEEMKRIMGDSYRSGSTVGVTTDAATDATTDAAMDAATKATEDDAVTNPTHDDGTATASDSNPNESGSGKTSDNNEQLPSSSDHKSGDAKTQKEIDDDYYDYEYVSPGVCASANSRHYDPLCKDGCMQCCSKYCKERKGDFRKTHWCVACYRFGLTEKDYENIGMIAIFLLCNVLWGVLTFVSEPDTWKDVQVTNSSITNGTIQTVANTTKCHYITTYNNLTNTTLKKSSCGGAKLIDSKRIGPAMTLISLLIIFTSLPLIEHFNTLRPICAKGSKSIHMLLQGITALLLHIGTHFFIWQEWQSGMVTKTSLVTLLSLLLYPSFVLMGIGLYKWKDDKWLVGRYYNKEAATAVMIYLGSSQIIILAFDIIVGVVYSWIVGVILLFLHGSFLLVLASMVVWVLKNFYLPKAWRLVIGSIFFLFIVGGLIGVMFSSGTDAFLSFTMSWCCVLVILLVTSTSILVPKLKANNLIISETVLPAYEWDTDSGKLIPHYFGIYSLYGSLFVAMSWGVAATLFLNQLYIGMSATSCSVVVTCIVTAALSNHGKNQFSRAISSLQASEFLVLKPTSESPTPNDGSGKKMKKLSLVDLTIQKAMEKANKLFSETGQVEKTFGGVTESSTPTDATTETKSTTRTGLSGRTRSKRHGTLPRPSSDGKVLTTRILQRQRAFPNGDPSSTFPTAADLALDIYCIETAIANYMPYNSCCGQDVHATTEDDATEAPADDASNLENGTASTSSNTNSKTITYPVRHDEAPLHVLMEALSTLDQDYMLTVDHENDVAAAFRNLILKMSNTQISNSEAQYSVFLDWCRTPEQKETLKSVHLLDTFGKEAQIAAQRSTRSGGTSPIQLTKVFTWQESQVDRFNAFQTLLIQYQSYSLEQDKLKKKRAEEDAAADARRSQALREAEDRRRQEQADEYRRQHQAEAEEMERKRKADMEVRRKKYEEEQARKRLEMQQEQERERKEEEERNRLEMERNQNANAAETERLAKLRAERKKVLDQRRKDRERKQQEETKRAELKLKNEEKRRRRDDNDHLIHQMNNASGANKYMTDELFTNKALQKELALTKLVKDPKHPTKLMDSKWTGKKAIMINPRNETTVSRTLTNNGTYQWARPDEFCTNPQFINADNADAADNNETGYSAGDVCQGSLGDCWFLSAMAVVAAHPKLMDCVMVTKETNPEGFYIVRVFKHGEWHNVVIDDTIPCKKWGSGLRPICVKSKSGNELWMSLLEKAYSKYHGSYEAINGGQVHVGLADLTGGSAGKIVLDEKRAEIASGELFAQVKQYFDSGYLMGAGSPSGSDTDISEMGIVQGHAYSILNIIEESDQNGSHQLIELRNPWGSGEWKGQWSDRDQRSWTSRMRQRLKYTAAQSDTDDGTFWMSFQDFCRNYSEISLCRMFQTVSMGGTWHKAVMRAEWKGKTAGGCPQPANKNSQYNPQWLLKLTRPGHVFIQLEQAKPNFAPGRIAHEDLVSVAIFVMKLKGKRLGNGIYGGMESNSAPFINAQIKTLDITKLNMNADGYTVVCTTFKKAKEAGMTLTVYSDAPFDPSILVKNKDTGEDMITRMYHENETPGKDGKCFPQSR